MILDIKASGYDYPEFPVMSFAEMSEEEFSRLEKMASAPVACNLFPSYIPLSDNNRDLDRVREYLDIAFTRAIVSNVVNDHRDTLNLVLAQYTKPMTAAQTAKFREYLEARLNTRPITIVSGEYR